MKTIRLISWNVNGIRAAYKKGLLDWFAGEEPDILCLQETKAHPDQLTNDVRNVAGYSSYFSSAEKKGYSGVAIYSREEPVEVEYGFGKKQFDTEGRSLIAHFEDFTLYNVYFPNGKASPERLAYKLAFYDVFARHVEKLRKAGRNIVICGDVNTAHKEIDLARPKANEKTSGFLPVERAWIDSFLARGYIDIFRTYCRKPEKYTWWDQKTGARKRNVGWRIDYFYISESLRKMAVSASILHDVMGSDHCPIDLVLQLKK
ncbi:MAG: exodeoxyribonuclease III [Chitinivibrionales bacterium]|nr:exodeoxyribonuclease III [Chitinivibrionales bacterium]